MPDAPSRNSGQSRATRRPTEVEGTRPADRFAWERALRDSGLPFGTRGVLAILGGYMDKTSTRAWPSLDTLATACGLGRRQVSNHLRPALELGWLTRNSGRGPRSVTTYAAQLPAGVSAAPSGPTLAESGLPVARTSGQPASLTRTDLGNRPPESGQSASRERAAGRRLPSQEQVKTTSTSPPATTHGRSREEEVDDETDSPNLLRTLVDALPDDLRQAAQSDPRQLDVACGLLGAAGWTSRDLERALRGKNWTGARGLGAVISWARHQAAQRPPVEAPRRMRRSSSNNCPNGAPFAADGTCCLEHDAEGDVA